MVTSAAEAELGAAFQNAQKGAQFRNTLIELGYPQQPTTIFVDNTVAEGLATNTINAKPLPKDKFEQFLPYIVVEVDANLEPVPRHTVVLQKL